MKAKLSMICSRQSNGSYFAVCPDIKGCFTQGDTYEQAVCQITELARMSVREDLTKDDAEALTQKTAKIFSEFEVTA